MTLSRDTRRNEDNNDDYGDDVHEFVEDQREKPKGYRSPWVLAGFCPRNAVILLTWGLREGSVGVETTPDSTGVSPPVNEGARNGIGAKGEALPWRRPIRRERTTPQPSTDKMAPIQWKFLRKIACERFSLPVPHPRPFTIAPSSFHPPTGDAFFFFFIISRQIAFLILFPFSGFDCNVYHRCTGSISRGRINWCEWRCWCDVGVDGCIRFMFRYKRTWG